MRDVLTSLQDEVTSRVAKATSSGYRVEMHVIGDRAVDVALNALRDAKVAAAKRPTLIHCQVARYQWRTPDFNFGVGWGVNLTQF